MSAAGALWGVLTVSAALLCPPAPWALGPGAVVAGVWVILAPRSSTLAAMVGAVAAGGVWLAGLGGVGLAAWALLLGALILLPLGRGGLPSAVPWAVATLALIEGLRGWLVADTLPALAGLTGALMVRGLVVAAVAAGARVSRLHGVALVLAGCVLSGRATQAMLLPPSSEADVVAAAGWRALGPHEATLVNHPAWGLRAVALRPSWHGLALGLGDSMGLERVLGAGWRPAGARLSGARLVRVARWLDLRGRGGEGSRLLWRGRDDPEIAWLAELFAREQGRHLELPQARAPEGVPRLPGSIPLGWSVTAAHPRDLEWEQERPAMGLVLQTSAGVGGGRLLVRVDGAPAWWAQVPAGQGRVPLPGALSPGPHRLQLRQGAASQHDDGADSLVVRALSAAP